MSSKKRLFVAIGLPEEIKKKLEEIQKQLRRFAIDAKWVKPEGIHLTLKFLGYVEEDQIAQISKLLGRVSSESSVVHLIRINGLGFFPSARRPNVLWAGLACEGLAKLQEEMENEFAAIGFEKENRAFSPHLTLARFREAKGLMQLAQETEKLKNVILGEFQPTHFSLYQSVLHPHGAQYTVLESFMLKEK